MRRGFSCAGGGAAGSAVAKKLNKTTPPSARVPENALGGAFGATGLCALGGSAWAGWVGLGQVYVHFTCTSFWELDVEVTMTSGPSVIGTRDQNL